MKDDLTGYTWLQPSDLADSKAATDALSKYISAFGCMMRIGSDRDAHFTAAALQKLTEEARVRHHLATAYCTLAKGTIESLCKEVLIACTALLSEWKLAPKKCPGLVDCIQSITIQPPLERSGKNEEGEL